MDKSLGTNLHLWRFFTRAKQIVGREFIYTCSAPPPTLPPPTMLDKCTRYFSRVSTLYGGKEGEGRTHFETENSAFLKLRFKNLMQLHKCPKEFCPPLEFSGFTLSQHISMSSHELLSLPRTNMKNEGSGNVTGLKLESRTRSQSRTRSPSPI